MAEKIPHTTSASIIEEEWPDDIRLSPLRVLFRQHELIASLIYREIRARYKQSILGIAWAVINPIVMTVVYTVVFSVFLGMKAPNNLPYSVFVFTALVPWTFFSQTINLGTECLVANFNLITKIYFPREVLLVSLVLSKVVDLALGMLVLIALYIYYQVHVTWLVVFVIPALFIQLCLLLGVVLILSSTNLFYRDIRHVVQLLTVVWMYMTPIIYPIEKVSRKLLPIYMLNPMVSIIETYKRVALYGQPPLWGYLGMSAAISLVVLIVGYRVFKKLEPGFAETI